MSFWNAPENQARGDSPCWQLPKITEEQEQAALLYIVQCAIRADAEPERLQALQDDEDEKP